jgi:hypothetical protein
MGVLIAILGQGKGTWSHLKQLIEKSEYDKIYIITNDFGVEKYQPSKNETMLKLNLDETSKQIRDSIIRELKGPLSDELEVDINITSGNGKEHAALISAVLRMGVGARIVDIIGDKVEEL